MFTICRIFSWCLYNLRLLKRGPWGSNWFAIGYYSKFNYKKAMELLDQMYPEIYLP